MRVLVIDNYDSFVYNLVQYLAQLGAEVTVRRNDEVDLEELGAFDGVLVSPGPGTPERAGASIAAIHAAARRRLPLLGVCLGHQAIGEAYGGRVVRAARVMHGKMSRIAHDGTGLFAGLPSPLEVMRYHSLIVERASLPDSLEILATSTDDDTEIQAVRHVEHPVWGVQFHPESVLTQHGKQLLKNFLTLAGC